jgi:putative tryptophan/tyrosine transport system substrate-binding protein
MKGAKPGELSISPRQYQLHINLQTAKEIGHEVPAGLVLRADKVIE